MLGIQTQGCRRYHGAMAAAQIFLHPCFYRFKRVQAKLALVQICSVQMSCLGLIRFGNKFGSKFHQLLLRGKFYHLGPGYPVSMNPFHRHMTSLDKFLLIEIGDLCAIPKSRGTSPFNKKRGRLAQLCFLSILLNDLAFC